MIAVFGGTGTLGRELLPRLRADGRPVRVVARHAPPRPPAQSELDVEWVAGEVRDPRALDAALRGVDTVISAIAGFGGSEPLGSRAVDRDGNIALIEATRRAGVGALVLLSIHDAGPDHPIELFRDKWAAEEALRASGLSSTIIRPTAYLESWLGLVGGPLVETGKTRIFGTGRNPINFVSVADVAGFVQAAIDDTSLRGSAIEVPGPENLTLDDLASLVESASGRTGRKDHAPRAMLRLARLATRVPKPVLSALIGAALVMDTRDMTVDGPSLRAAFPSIPMTTAAEVAQRMFGGVSADSQPRQTARP
jgi:NADH dehydrogenase